MRHYEHFEKALDDWYERGGAMSCVSRGANIGAVWSVGSHEEIAGIHPGGDAKATTMQALREGGLDDDSITDYMTGWRDQDGVKILPIAVAYDPSHALPWSVVDTRSTARNKRRAKTRKRLLLLIKDLLATFPTPSPRPGEANVKQPE